MFVSKSKKKLLTSVAISITAWGFLMYGGLTYMNMPEVHVSSNKSSTSGKYIAVHVEAPLN